MDNKVRLIFTHTKANPPINKWIRECKYLLNKNDRAKNIGSRIQVASKQPKNMKQLVGGIKRGEGGLESLHLMPAVASVRRGAR